MLAVVAASTPPDVGFSISVFVCSPPVPTDAVPAAAAAAAAAAAFMAVELLLASRAKIIE